MSKTKISILGCGWLGLSLSKRLIESGFLVKGSVTNPAKFELLRASGVVPYRIVLQDDAVDCDNENFFDCDVLIISVPPGRATGNVANFSLRIKNVIPFIQKARVHKVIFISSTSVYPDNFQVATEEDLLIPDKESGKVLLEAEGLFQSEPEFKTTVLRFGGLIGADRNPARFLQKVSAPMPDAPVNLIHQDDCIGIILAIIYQEVWGETFNACCPEHPMKSEFYGKSARIAKLTEPVFSGTGPYKIVDCNKLMQRLHYRFKFANPMDYLDNLDFTSNK